MVTNDINLNIIIAGYLDCINTHGFPFIFFLIKKRSNKIKLKIGNCCAPFTIGFTCVVLAYRTSNPSFIIADFQRTIPTLIYKHSTTIEIYTLRSKKCHSHFKENFFQWFKMTFYFFCTTAIASISTFHSGRPKACTPTKVLAGLSLSPKSCLRRVLNVLIIVLFCIAQKRTKKR